MYAMRRWRLKCATAKNGVLCPGTGLGLPHTDKNTAGLLHSAISIMRHGARKFMHRRRKFDFPFSHLLSAAAPPSNTPTLQISWSHSFASLLIWPIMRLLDLEECMHDRCFSSGTDEEMWILQRPTLLRPLLLLLLRKEAMWSGRRGA